MRGQMELSFLLDPFRNADGSIAWPAVAALITVIGALAVFTLTQITQLAGLYVTHRRRRAAFIRALFAEIDFNTAELTIFIDTAPDPDVLASVLRRRPGRIPHITDARHTLIYDRSVHDISFLDDGIVRGVVQFYGTLEKLKVQIDGLQLASYPTISTEGRIRTIEEIFETARVAAFAGRSILAAMRRKYPALTLRLESLTLLKAAQPQQPSELDRVRSGHRKPPQRSS